MSTQMNSYAEQLNIFGRAFLAINKSTEVSYQIENFSSKVRTSFFSPFSLHNALYNGGKPVLVLIENLFSILIDTTVSFFDIKNYDCLYDGTLDN